MLTEVDKVDPLIEADPVVVLVDAVSNAAAAVELTV